MRTVKARLDPFLFSPDTNFRFILLIISVFGASLFGYYNLYNQFHQQELTSGWLKCFENAEAAFPLTGLDPASPDYMDRAFLNNQYSNDCNESMEQTQARWIMYRLGLLMLVAGVIYWLMPVIRIRRDRLSVLTSESDSEIMTSLLDLSRDMGLSRSPVFMLRALNPVRSGLAFGRLGRYYIVLNGGLVTLYYQDQKRFNTIVLHELAHLRNNDVDKTYFSLAVVISFVLVTLIPLFIGNLAGLISNFLGNLSFVLWQTFSVAIYLPVIYIVLASILRSREVYADARVLTLDTQDETLRTELASLSSSHRSHWSTFFGLHPKPAWRIKMLDEPDLLFGLSAWDAFLAGIISTFALRELDFFLSILLPSTYENYSLFGASLFFIPFVASIVGSGIWQRVFVSQIHSQKLAGFGRYGLSLGAGMVLGLSFSFSAFIDTSLAATYSSIGMTFLFNIFIGLILVASLFLLFRWVAVSANVWLETATNPINLRRVTSFGLLTTGVLMSFWVGGFYILYKFGYEVVYLLALALLPSLQRVTEFAGLGLNIYTESITASLIGLSILLTVPVWLFVLIWVFPLLSKLRKSRQSIENVFIGFGSKMDLPAKTHSQLKPFWALLAGVAAAVGVIGFIVVLRILLHLGTDPATRTTMQWLFNFRIFQFGLAIFVQIVVAVAVAGSVKIGWAHGLLAAFVAGLLISLGFATILEISDCIPILQLGNPSACANFLEWDLSIWLGPVLIVGAFFSILPAFIASWIGSFVRDRISARVPPSTALS